MPNHSPAWVCRVGLEEHPIPLNNINDSRLRIHSDDRATFDAMLAVLGRSDAPYHFAIKHRLGRRGDGQAAQAVGFAAYLQKPLRRSALQECFRAVLPRLRSDDTEPAPLVTSHSLKEATRRPKALLAEDNPVNQLVAVKMLEKLGYAVGVASDGGQAVEAVLQGGYALVVMDCMMPEMDGFTAARQIREQEARTGGGAHLPIIALTASVLSDDREACFQAGMDDFLSKPIRVADLTAALDRWMKAANSSNEVTHRSVGGEEGP